MVVCLDPGADLHMAQLMPLPFTISCSSKSRLVLPFWCWLSWVIPDKIQQGHKMVVCVHVCVCVQSSGSYCYQGKTVDIVFKVNFCFIRFWAK